MLTLACDVIEYANFIQISVFNAREGGGVSESTDRRGCATLALEVVPKNLIFT